MSMGPWLKTARAFAVLNPGAVDRGRTGDLLLRFHLEFPRSLGPARARLYLERAGRATLPLSVVRARGATVSPRLRGALTVIRDACSGFPGRGRGSRPTMEMLCQLSYNGLCLVLPATSSGTEQVVIGVIRLFSSLRLARFDDFEEDLFIYHKWGRVQISFSWLTLAENPRIPSTGEKRSDDLFPASQRGLEGMLQTYRNLVDK